MGRMHSTKIAFALACLLALEGCAAAALSVAGMVGGRGIDYTLNGTVDRTYVAPVAGTKLATLVALRRMGMTIDKSEKSDNGWIIEASTENRTIEIDLESLSDLTTQARVEVSRADYGFIKDSSTGKGILDQISVDLSGISPKKQRFATVQLLLSELGYEPGKVDGLMGRKTRNAIRRFQRKHAMRPNGDITRQLVAKLRKEKAVHQAAAKKAKQVEQMEQEEPNEDS